MRPPDPIGVLETSSLNCASAPTLIVEFPQKQPVAQ